MSEAIARDTLESKMTYPLIRCLAGLALSAVCTFSMADPVKLGWPARQITWQVGYVPGGTVDVLTRMAAQQLAARIDIPVVVENKPGASGAIALQAVARSSESDGMLITVPGPILYGKPQPQIGKQLAPVILMAEGPMVVVAAKDAPATLKDALSEARRQPEKWSYASSGTGTSQHLAGELLNQVASTRIMHVPYKGGAQAAVDVIGGQIPLAVLGPTPVLAHIHSGALRAYAVTTRKRLEALPQVPTMEEAGFPGYDASQWFAVAASPKVSKEALLRVNGLLQEIFQTPEFRKAVAAAGMTRGSGTPAELVSFIERDTRKWDELVAKTGISVKE